MIRLFVSVCIILLCSCSQYTEQKHYTPEIKISDYGIYEGKQLYSDRLGSSPGQTISRNIDARITETTEIIPKILGIHFGVEYRISQYPEQFVLMGVKWIPNQPIKRRDGTLVSEIFYEQKKVVGHSLVLGYGLDAENELVPDSWMLELSIDGEVYARKEFVMIDERHSTTPSNTPAASTQ